MHAVQVKRRCQIISGQTVLGSSAPKGEKLHVTTSIVGERLAERAGITKTECNTDVKV
jgi:hypothetical protein